MTAEFDEEQISSYLDEELPPAERERMERVLADSAPAARQLADFQSLRQLLQDLPRESAPVDLHDSIRAHIEREISQTPPTKGHAADKIPASRKRLPLAVFLSSAALVLVMVGSVAYYQLTHPLLLTESAAPSSEMMLAAAEDMQSAEAQATDKMFSTAAERDLPAAAALSQSLLSEQEAGSPLSESSAIPLMAPAPALTPLSAPENKPLLSRALPAPPLNEQQSTEDLLARLEASPKLSGQLAPGELVRYITTQDEQVAVVELSVVDVKQSFGEIQVLLTRNQIAPTTRSLLPADSADETSALTDQKEKQSEPGTRNESLAGSAPPDHAQRFSEMASAGKPSDLMAFYVEASETQLLQTLNQLETLASVKTVHLGEAPRLAEELYFVVPVAQQAQADRPELGMSTPVDRMNGRNADSTPAPADEEITLSLTPAQPQEQSRALMRGRMTRQASPSEEKRSSLPVAEGKQTPETLSQELGLEDSLTARMSPSTAVDSLPAMKAGDPSQVTVMEPGYQIPVRLVPVPEKPEAAPRRQITTSTPALPKTLSAGPEINRNAIPATSPRVRVLLILSRAELPKS